MGFSTPLMPKTRQITRLPLVIWQDFLAFVMWKKPYSHFLLTVLSHCLKKHKRLLHSKITSKTQVQTTLIAKCPPLLCSRQFTFSKISLLMLQLKALFTVGFYEKNWDYETKNCPVMLTTANNNADILRHLLVHR